jgi:hypothetical protein
LNHRGTEATRKESAINGKKAKNIGGLRLLHHGKGF